MLSKRDVKMIRHVEKYGFITISQCYKMFFNDRAYGYDLARKRLVKLQEQGHLNSQIDYLEKNPEKIFFIDEDFSSPSKHTVYIMNTLAELVKLGADILHFSREQIWLDGSYRSDGYVVFRMYEYVFQVFIEVEGNTNHKKKPRTDIVQDFDDKYSAIIESNEPMSILYDIFNLPINDKRINPLTRILVIDQLTHSIPWEVENVSTIQVDFLFNGLGRILI